VISCRSSFEIESSFDLLPLIRVLLSLTGSNIYKDS
jgi:hypothetical protein